MLSCASCPLKRTHSFFLAAAFFSLFNLLILMEHPVSNMILFTAREYNDTNSTSTATNTRMIEYWRRIFLQWRFTRIYISEQCPFAYLTTLKTAVTTTRLMIDSKECGFGADLWNNKSQLLSCGDHKCTLSDYVKIESPEILTVIFVQNPIRRFESAYNYVTGENALNLAPHESNDEKFRAYIRSHCEWVRGSEDSIFEIKNYHTDFHLVHLWPLMHSACVKISSKDIKVLQLCFF